eukprot:2494470-Prorocentrum_lima.AAC.1
MRGPGRACKNSITSLRCVAEKPLTTRMLRLLLASLVVWERGGTEAEGGNLESWWLWGKLTGVLML